LAALGVVVWHYQHFYFIGTELPAAFDRTEQPLYRLLWPFYEHGMYAVPLFFVLSGFVFFHLYAEAVRTGGVVAYEFFVLRLSRLYPLHVATLLLVLIGQAVAKALNGDFLVYPCNDPFHLALNLGLLQYWVPRSRFCWSFNAPAWSVSAEAFLYCLFFLFALGLPSRAAGRLLLTLGVMLIAVGTYTMGAFLLLGEPVFCFFGGGLACLCWQWARKQAWLLGITVAAFVVTLSVLLYANTNVTRGTVAFPALILGLALLQSFRPNAGDSLRLLGDISYSIYLLHFPLQLMLILARQNGLLAVDFARIGGWILFFVLLAGSVMLSYHWLERPAQAYLRRVLLRQRRAVALRAP
jgi:peptidoglycan/LPS O-acetylase OafA/YrhL